MQQFPVLTENQVTLLRAEYNSGNVSDESLQLALHDDQIVYSVFDNLEAALVVAEDLVRNGLIECVVYGKDGEVIRYITPVGWSQSVNPGG